MTNVDSIHQTNHSPIVTTLVSTIISYIITTHYVSIVAPTHSTYTFVTTTNQIAITSI